MKLFELKALKEYPFRGYKVSINENGGIYEMTYDPPLPENLARMFSKCESRELVIPMIEKAINAVHAIRTSKEGNAAGSNNIGLPVASSLTGRM